MGPQGGRLPAFDAPDRLTCSLSETLLNCCCVTQSMSICRLTSKCHDILSIRSLHGNHVCTVDLPNQGFLMKIYENEKLQGFYERINHQPMEYASPYAVAW